jgi:hypothetical protein
MRTFLASKLLCVVALICFVLGAFHVGFPVHIVAAGPAFLAASFLVP